MAKLINNKILQNAKTTTSNGNSIGTSQANNLAIHISGTSTSFNINFMASLDDTNYFPVEGIKLSNTTVVANSTSVLNEAWGFDASMWVSFQAQITAIENGNISVYAGTFY